MDLRKEIEAAARKAGQIMLSASSIEAATDAKSGHANSGKVPQTMLQ